MSMSEIPQAWRATTLGGALGRSEGGGTPPRDVEDYWSGNIPWASVKDIVKGEGFTPEETITPAGLAHSTSKLIPAGTNIFAARMGVGAVARYPFPVAINQDLVALTPSSELDPDYLFYWLQARKAAFVAVARLCHHGASGFLGRLHRRAGHQADMQGLRARTEAVSGDGAP
jgi:type I restriction enzyme S subunit